MSKLWSPKGRGNAYGRMSVLLPMRELSDAVETAKRRLLRVLLVWDCEVSSNAAISKLLCLISSDPKGDGLCSMSIDLEKTIQLYREISNDTRLLLNFKPNAAPDSIVSELVLKSKLEAGNS